VLGGVFICYRREDSAGFARLIYDRLTHKLGHESVFFDVDNIAPGLDFVDILSERVGQCDALIAVIGRNWASSKYLDDQRRLDDPNDFVRIEIEAALARKIRVIPILVDGATMPRPDDLPDTLKKLTRRQGIEISHTRFDSDVERLTRALSLLEDELCRRDADEAEPSVREERGRQEAVEAARAALVEQQRREGVEAAAKAEQERQLAEAAGARHAVKDDRKTGAAGASGRKNWRVATVVAFLTIIGSAVVVLLAESGNRWMGTPLVAFNSPSASSAVASTPTSAQPPAATMFRGPDASSRVPTGTAAEPRNPDRSTSADDAYLGAQMRYANTPAEQNALGDRYSYGLSVDQDYVKAMIWYQKAADQGFAPAQLNVGWLYENGLGVGKDLVKARKWYQKSAERGNAEAKISLDRLDGE
jgi:hypothetical protein